MAMNQPLCLSSAALQRARPFQTSDQIINKMRRSGLMLIPDREVSVSTVIS
jgi:hypothetical protein